MSTTTEIVVDKWGTNPAKGDSQFYVNTDFIKSKGRDFTPAQRRKKTISRKCLCLKIWCYILCRTPQ